MKDFSQQKKIAVYTAIFGKKDGLHAPQVVPDGCDFICFTDQPLSSNVWKIVRIDPPVPGDMVRSARKVKVLAHTYLSEYELSIWVDGNILLKSDLAAWAEKNLSEANLAVLDHARARTFPIRSLHEELVQLLAMEKAGKHQEDAALMESQAEQYFKEGFPDTGSLAWTMVLARRHNAPDVVSAMEHWWKEIETWSNRDQISFNYIAWKTGLRFSYFPDDPLETTYFRRMSHHLPLYRKIYSYFLGAIKRIRKLLYI